MSHHTEHPWRTDLPTTQDGEALKRRLGEWDAQERQHRRDLFRWAAGGDEKAKRELYRLGMRRLVLDGVTVMDWR